MSWNVITTPSFRASVLNKQAKGHTEWNLQLKSLWCNRLGFTVSVFKRHSHGHRYCVSKTYVNLKPSVHTLRPLLLQCLSSCNWIFISVEHKKLILTFFKEAVSNVTATKCRLKSWTIILLGFVDSASLYSHVNKANMVHNLCFVDSLSL